MNTVWIKNNLKIYLFAFFLLVIGFIISFLQFAMVSYAGEWKRNQQDWWYENEDHSYPVSSWQWIDDNMDGTYELYYFNERGYCVKNTMQDNRTLNKSGMATENETVIQKSHDSFDGWNNINGKEAFFSPTGIMWSNSITPDNFYVDVHGWKIMDSEINSDEMAQKSMGKTYIVIKKSTHFLERWENGVKTHSYVISAGQKAGDKEFEGDFKTPEGDFYVCKKIPNSQYHLGIGVSYPGIEDAQRGLEQGMITEKIYQEIVNAQNLGRTPNWYTPLGGEIEIHGNRQLTDATRGCIGMRNEDIEELYRNVKVGDRILILP